MKKYKKLTLLILIFMTIFQYCMEDRSEQRAKDLEKIKKMLEQEESNAISAYLENIINNDFLLGLRLKGYCLSVAEKSDFNQDFLITDDYIPGQLHISEDIEKEYSRLQKKYLKKSYSEDDFDY